MWDANSFKTKLLNVRYRFTILKVFHFLMEAKWNRFLPACRCIFWHLPGGGPPTIVDCIWSDAVHSSHKPVRKLPDRSHQVVDRHNTKRISATNRHTRAITSNFKLRPHEMKFGKSLWNDFERKKTISNLSRIDVASIIIFVIPTALPPWPFFIQNLLTSRPFDKQFAVNCS